MSIIRTDNFAVYVSLDGQPLGLFDKATGGHANSEEVKYRKGGMGPQVAVGGGKIVDNITVSRAFDPAIDGPLLPTLVDRRGTGDMVVTKQPLDANKQPFGKPIIVFGKLKMVTFPDADAEANAVGMLALEVSTGGDISA